MAAVACRRLGLGAVHDDVAGVLRRYRQGVLCRGAVRGALFLRDRADLVVLCGQPANPGTASTYSKGIWQSVVRRWACL